MTEMTDKPKPLTLGEAATRADALRNANMTFAEIGAVMGVSAIRARDLCVHYDRHSGSRHQCQYSFELSQRAILALLTSTPATQFGNDMAERLRNLLQIAASHSRTSLLDEYYVGRTVCDEIEVWLASHGLGLRKSKSSRTPEGQKNRQRAAKLLMAGKNGKSRTALTPAGAKQNRSNQPITKRFVDEAELTL